MPNQCGGIDSLNQFQRIEEFLRASSQIVSVEQMGDRQFDLRHCNVLSQTVDSHNSVVPCHA